jgi:DNA-binding LacI/PurR family transcriptional regulator
VRQDTRLPGNGFATRLLDVAQREGRPLPPIVPTRLVVRESTGTPRDFA